MSRRSLALRQDSLALLLMALLATVLLRQSLLPSHTLLPLDLITTIAPWAGDESEPLQNPLISDPFYSFYPRRHILTEAVQRGEIPLWNPYIMSGSPILANPNFQAFYPPNLLAALILPADQSLPCLTWFHLVLTGGLMYFFLKSHDLSWSACLVGEPPPIEHRRLDAWPVSGL